MPSLVPRHGNGIGNTLLLLILPRIEIVTARLSENNVDNNSVYEEKEMDDDEEEENGRK